jgi:hypothetical protein
MSWDIKWNAADVIVGSVGVLVTIALAVYEIRRRNRHEQPPAPTALLHRRSPRESS